MYRKAKRLKKLTKKKVIQMNHEKQIKLIKEAINDGKRVFMTPSKAYEVIKDSIGQYLIKCHINDNFVGLHGRKNTNREHIINYLCQRDGNPYPATIEWKEDKDSGLVFVDTIQLQKAH